MATKGYHSYRGRRSGRSWLLVAVLVLLLAAACAYLFLQRYLRYTDDGGMYFALPFLEETAAEPDVQPESGEEEREMNLVIEEPEESEPAEEPYGDRRLLGLDAPPADAETLNALLAQTGANGFVCSLRDNAGLVYYTSTAALRDAVASGAADAQTLSQLCQETEALAVARLNCFHDSYYAWANMETAGLCQGSGYIWYDSLSYHWLDPAKEAARAYVISLAVECAQMGFDELLLEEMQYPRLRESGEDQLCRRRGGADGVPCPVSDGAAGGPGALRHQGVPAGGRAAADGGGGPGLRRDHRTGSDRAFAPGGRGLHGDGGPGGGSGGSGSPGGGGRGACAGFPDRCPGGGKRRRDRGAPGRGKLVYSLTGDVLAAPGTGLLKTGSRRFFSKVFTKS